MKGDNIRLLKPVCEFKVFRNFFFLVFQIITNSRFFFIVEVRDITRFVDVESIAFNPGAIVVKLGRVPTITLSTVFPLAPFTSYRVPFNFLILVFPTVFTVFGLAHNATPKPWRFVVDCPLSTIGLLRKIEPFQETPGSDMRDRDNTLFLWIGRFFFFLHHLFDLPSTSTRTTRTTAFVAWRNETEQMKLARIHFLRFVDRHWDQIGFYRLHKIDAGRHLDNFPSVDAKCCRDEIALGTTRLGTIDRGKCDPSRNHVGFSVSSIAFDQSDSFGPPCRFFVAFVGLFPVLHHQKALGLRGRAKRISAWRTGSRHFRGGL